MKPSQKIFLLALLPSLLLSACGDKKDAAKTSSSEAPSPVVVKVDKTGITEAQLAVATSKIPNINNEQEKQVLQKLIEQELLAKEALDSKLEQDTKVANALEISKRQILAQAYFDKLTQSIPKPSDTNIQDFYVQNPTLFSNRKVYQLAEISIQDPAKVERVKQLMKEAKSMEELASKFHSERIIYKTATIVKGAEDIPLQLLDQLSKMGKGAVTMVSSAGGASLLQLQDTMDKPVTVEQAKPLISKLLHEQKRKTAYDAEIEKLRKQAKIEFSGKFADLNQAKAASNTEAPATQPLEQFNSNHK